jgi:hypothetical protein
MDKIFKVIGMVTIIVLVLIVILGSTSIKSPMQSTSTIIRESDYRVVRFSDNGTYHYIVISDKNVSIK